LSVSKDKLIKDKLYKMIHYDDWIRHTKNPRYILVKFKYYNSETQAVVSILEDYEYNGGHGILQSPWHCHVKRLKELTKKDIDYYMVEFL